MLLNVTRFITSSPFFCLSKTNRFKMNRFLFRGTLTRFLFNLSIHFEAVCLWSVHDLTYPWVWQYHTWHPLNITFTNKFNSVIYLYCHSPILQSLPWKRPSRTSNPISILYLNGMTRLFCVTSSRLFNHLWCFSFKPHPWSTLTKNFPSTFLQAIAFQNAFLSICFHSV